MIANTELTPKIGMTFETFRAFAEGSQSWLSKDQLFITTDESLAIGTPVAVDVSLDDGTPLVRGLGRISWVRKIAMRADRPAGVGIGLIHLDAASAALVDALLRCRTAVEPSKEQDASPPVPTAEPVAEASESTSETHAESEPSQPMAADTVAATSVFADDHHFGEEGIVGYEPYIPDGHELDEFREVSFSDVENAVSREIDAAVVRHDIRARLGSPNPESPQPEATDAPDLGASFDDEVVDSLDLALTEIERPQEEESAQTEAEDSQEIRAMADAVALELSSADDSTPVVIAELAGDSDDDTQAVLEVETEAVDLHEFDQAGGEDTQAVAQVETESIDLLDAAEDRGEDTEASLPRRREESAAADEDEQAADEDEQAADAKQPPYDPWDLDVSSFIDDALRERAALGQGRGERASSEVMPPPDRLDPAPVTPEAPATGTAAAADLTSASASPAAEVISTGRDQDDTLDIGPGRTPEGPELPVSPLASAPIGTTSPPAASEHPEARRVADDLIIDDKTLTFGTSDAIRDAVAAHGSAALGEPVPSATVPVPDMDAPPDFGTMETRLELPDTGELPTADAPEAEETAPITLPVNAFREEFESAEPAIASVDSVDPTADATPRDLGALVEATQPPTIQKPQAGGYYAEAGRERRSAFPLLAAVFAALALGALLLVTGSLDGPIARLTAAFRGAEEAPAQTPEPSSAGSPAPPATEPAVPARATTPANSDEIDRTAAIAAGDNAVPEDPASGPAPTPTAAIEPLDHPDPIATASQPVEAPTTPTANPTPARPATEATHAPAQAFDPAALRAELLRVAENWAAAWSRQDSDAYLAHYDESFAPDNGLGRDAWEEQRPIRVRAPQSLTVQVSDLSVEQADGDRATVRFFQSYRATTAAGKRNLGTWKRFELVRRADSWRIARESVVR